MIMNFDTNSFLNFCQKAEESQCLPLARYLTWMGYNSSKCPYLATLQTVNDCLYLMVWKKDDHTGRRNSGHRREAERWVYDLSEAGEAEKRAEEEAEQAEHKIWLAEYRQENLDDFWNRDKPEDQAVLDALCLLLFCSSEELYEMYGDEKNDVLDECRKIVQPHIEDEWDDSREPGLCGVVIYGIRIATGYTGAAGKWWDTVWMAWDDTLPLMSKLENRVKANG